MTYGKAQKTRQLEQAREENRRLKQQVADLREQLSAGAKPLKQRIGLLEARCRILEAAKKETARYKAIIACADALSAAVKAEFDYVRSNHPEAKDGFSCAYFQAMEKARDAYEGSKA